MNLTDNGFKTLMYSKIDKTNGGFGKDESSQILLRKSMIRKVYALKSQTDNASAQEKKYLLHFMTKKFLDFFGSDMSSEYKKSFFRALYT